MPLDLYGVAGPVRYEQPVEATRFATCSPVKESRS